MALREITEAGGRSWKVWDTFPSVDTHNPDSALGKFLTTPGMSGNINSYYIEIEGMDELVRVRRV